MSGSSTELKLKYMKNRLGDNESKKIRIKVWWQMWKLKSCTRCGGDVLIDKDHYGWYMQCLQCGYLWDLEELAGAKEPLQHKQRTISNNFTRRG